MATKSQRDRRKIRIAKAEAYLADAPVRGGRFFNLPDGVSEWNPKKEGAYEIDIVPYEVTDDILRYVNRPKGIDVGDWYQGRTFAIHQQVGPENHKVMCPYSNFGKRCPICDHRGLVAQDPKADYKKDIKPLKTKDRRLVLIIDRAEPQKGLQLWDEAPYNFDDQLKAKISNASPKKKAVYDKFYDPNEGSTLRLIATEKTVEGGKPFLWFTVDDFQERDEPIPDEILFHGINLDKLPVVKTYDEIKKLFHGADDDDAGPGDKPSRNGARSGGDEPDEEESDGKGQEDGWGEGEAGGDEAEDQGQEDGPEYEVGQEVSFDSRGDTITGVIASINEDKGLAKVKTGKDKFSFVNLDDLSPAEPEPETEPEPQAPKGRRGAQGAGTTSTRGSASRSEPEPEGDDDDGFSWGEEETGAEEEPEPAPKPKTSGKPAGRPKSPSSGKAPPRGR